MSLHNEGYYIGTLINPLYLPEYYINELDFIDVQEEYRGIPIRLDIEGWRKHIVYATG